MLSAVPDTWVIKVNERVSVSLSKARPLGSSLDA